uniref:Uncharacterized protein n=1 Tax=candidate division CPR3 bacterium TaxID=2268181 RepID=A0A7V3J9N4_UNCC3
MFRKIGRARVVYLGDRIGEVGLKRASLSEVRLSKVLEKFADLYKISRKPGDYIFTAVWSVTADIPNENKDCFGEYELLSLKDTGDFVYETFREKPIFCEHDDSDMTKSSGIIVDTLYDDVGDERKVINMLAIDMRKNAYLVGKLLRGDKQGFSMGCVCERTRCSVCNHVAEDVSQFCEHIANKFAYGKNVFEWCEGVTFRELSYVNAPADPQAWSLEVAA